MAKDIKKDLQEITVEEKLKSLYQLQVIFSEIDHIKTLRGELPLEVQDLEDGMPPALTERERMSPMGSGKGSGFQRVLFQ